MSHLRGGQVTVAKDRNLVAGFSCSRGSLWRQGSHLIRGAIDDKELKRQERTAAQNIELCLVEGPGLFKILGRRFDDDVQPMISARLLKQHLPHLWQCTHAVPTGTVV